MKLVPFGMSINATKLMTPVWELTVSVDGHKFIEHVGLLW